MTPCELALRRPPTTGNRTLPSFLLAYVANQTAQLVHLLGGATVPPTLELEMWPAYDDDTGATTWAYGRWRNATGATWQWVPPVPAATGGRRRRARPFRRRASSLIETTPIFPAVLRPWVAKEEAAIFDNPLLLPGLYDQPAFGNCVWSTLDGITIVDAWRAAENATEIARVRAFVASWNAQHERGSRLVCRVLPQPSYFNGRFETYVVHATLEKGQRTLQLTFPAFVTFVNSAQRKLQLSTPDAGNNCSVAFAPTFTQDWLHDIGSLTAVPDRNAADPPARRKLDAVRASLAARYQAMGLETFVVGGGAGSYGDFDSAVLVAVVAGATRDQPVLLCDHIDTAYAENVFHHNGTRVSVPGADDNGSATATLLQAARALAARPVRLARDVWLVHLTGEEFPGDDVGARALDSFLLQGAATPSAIVVLDMIAWRRNASDLVVQVNAGPTEPSLRIARLAVDVAQTLRTPVALAPVLRTRWDPLSYLYNTDAVVFASSGWPTILFNEHINLQQNFDRPYYHRTGDTVDHLHVAYGSSVARVAIAAVAQLACS